MTWGSWWVSTLAYPTCLGLKGYVVVVVVDQVGRKVAKEKVAVEVLVAVVVCVELILASA